MKQLRSLVLLVLVLTSFTLTLLAQAPAEGPLVDLGENGPTMVLAALGIASIIAKITPQKSDNKALDAAFKIVHLLGLTKTKPKR
jgi:hypothetical protein